MALVNGWVLTKGNADSERVHLNKILAEIDVGIDTAGATANAYTDAALAGHVAALDPHTQYAMQTDVDQEVADLYVYIDAADATKQPLDATLTELAANNWVANAIPIGDAADGMSQVSFAANTFPARASTGNLVAKAITDGSLSALAGTAGQTVFLRGDGTNTSTLVFDGATGMYVLQNYVGNAGANQYRGEKARGSLATPSQALASDALVSLQGRAYHSGGAFSGNIGDVLIRLTENATNSAQGTEVLLRATPIGATTVSTVFTANPVGVTAPFGEYQTGVLSPAQITADQNDYAPTGHGTVRTLRLNSDASRTITGLAGGAAGRVLRIVNNGVNNIVLAHNSGSSTAGNRFLCVNAANVTIPQGGTVSLWYDGSSGAWRPQGI